MHGIMTLINNNFKQPNFDIIRSLPIMLILIFFLIYNLRKHEHALKNAPRVRKVDQGYSGKMHREFS